MRKYPGETPFNRWVGVTVDTRHRPRWGSGEYKALARGKVAGCCICSPPEPGYLYWTRCGPVQRVLRPAVVVGEKDPVYEDRLDVSNRQMMADLDAVAVAATRTPGPIRFG